MIIRTWINGHALPDIEAKRDLVVQRKGIVLHIDYRVAPSTYYYEYQSHNSIRIPKTMVLEWDLSTNLGSIFRNDLNQRGGGR